jgi:hypothetical protein
MIRRAAALVLAIALSPATLGAQDVVITITVPSADVHKGPSTVTPVIGHVSHGTTMSVQRNLGSWVKVPWPAAPDGVAYVHVSMGSLTPPVSPSAGGSVPGVSPSASSVSSSAVGQTMASPPRPAHHERVVIRTQGGAPISHVVGIGGLAGSMESYGATARRWRDDRLGFQVAVTRDQLASDVATDRLTSLQVEPAIVYGLFDHVSDYFWIRPYFGSGVGIRHQTLHQSAPVDTAVTSKNGVALHLFGGGELTFAGAPRFGLSVEFGYRRLPTSFPGFQPDQVGASLAGHWYVK